MATLPPSNTAVRRRSTGRAGYGEHYDCESSPNKGWLRGHALQGFGGCCVGGVRYLVQPGAGADRVSSSTGPALMAKSDLFGTRQADQTRARTGAVSVRPEG